MRKQDEVWDQPRDAVSGSKHLEVPSHTKPGAYVGLCNQGSTCYLNSLLQCLFFTPELREAICSCGNSGTGIIHSLIKLFQELMGRNTLVDTTGITKCLGIHNVHQQQDAEEYFRRLMDKIIEEKEEIRQLYEVKKVHTITCCECGLQTKVENPALSLSLSFKKLASNHAGYSVASALDEIQQENTFAGDDQLYCETCGCKQDATSKYCFGSLPPILVLHLKRYQFDSFTRFTKLSCEVSVPLLLSMSEENHTVVYYHLYAMCHHSGGINGGHYLAEIKSSENRCWFEFNDRRVRKIPESRISSDGRICVSRTAYLLMYRRCVDCSAELRPDGQDSGREEPALTSPSTSPLSWRHPSKPVMASKGVYEGVRVYQNPEVPYVLGRGGQERKSSQQRQPGSESKHGWPTGLQLEAGREDKQSPHFRSSIRSGLEEGGCSGVFQALERGRRGQFPVSLRERSS